MKGNTINVNVDKHNHKECNKHQQQQHTQQKLNVNSNNNNTHNQYETSSTKQITDEDKDKDKEHNNKDNQMLKNVAANDHANRKGNDNAESTVYKPIKTKSNVQNTNHKMLNLTRVERDKRFESKIESTEFQQNLTNIIKQNFTQKEVSESDDD
jgi:hypothetical protein